MHDVDGRRLGRVGEARGRVNMTVAAASSTSTPKARACPPRSTFRLTRPWAGLGQDETPPAGRTFPWPLVEYAGSLLRRTWHTVAAKESFVDIDQTPLEAHGAIVKRW